MTPPACFGVARPHDVDPDAILYAIGPAGRRAFLCRECRDALADVGVQAVAVIPAERGPERRQAPGRRNRDKRLGAFGSDRRAT